MCKCGKVETVSHDEKLLRLEALDETNLGWRVRCDSGDVALNRYFATTSKT